MTPNFRQIIPFLILLLGLTFPVHAQEKQIDEFDIRVCSYPKTPPYLFMVDKAPKGIDMDILTQIVQKTGLRASVEIMPLSNLLERLKEGSCDLAFGLSDAPIYRDFADFLFSVPLYYSTTSMFTRKSKPKKISSVGHLFNLKLAHKKSKVLSIGVEQAINDKRLERLTFSEHHQGLQLLEKDLIDAVLSDDVPFRYLLKTKGAASKYRRIAISFMPHIPSFIAFSNQIDMEKHATLKKDITQVLKELHLTGTLSNIIKSYVY